MLFADPRKCPEQGIVVLLWRQLADRQYIRLRGRPFVRFRRLLLTQLSDPRQVDGVEDRHDLVSRNRQGGGQIRAYPFRHGNDAVRFPVPAARKPRQQPVKFIVRIQRYGKLVCFP